MGYMYDAATSPQRVNWRAHNTLALSHYLTGPYASTSPDMAETLKLGFGVNLNWEREPGALVGATYNTGVAFGRDALSAIPSACPRDSSVSVKFSVDQYVSDLGACDNAFRGINSVLRPAGLLIAAYAEGAVIDHLMSLGLIQKKQWLSMSSAFPGFNPYDQNIGCVQMHDGQGNWIGTDIPGTDRNTLTDPRNFGIWWPTGSPFIFNGSPASPSKKENDLPSLVSVSESDCKTRGVPWPGVFTTDGESVKHVAHPSDITAFQKLGYAGPVEISLDEYYALGGK